MTTPAAHRLKAETSPYLQQHADNPVEWYPWGEEALRRAREEDRPILLSIGYSACHWCHVMAHESFEDAATAAEMNRLFVNIKVDREERPDLDKIYQSAHQLLNRRGGGWPLTVFLAPDDLAPFFAGTYFPLQARHGLPAFRDLLKAVHTFYNERREDVRAQNRRLRDYLESVAQGRGSVPSAGLGPEPLAEARRQLGASFDAEAGGFGDAPKFPHPTHLERLMHHWSASRAAGEADTEALQMATQTLQAMAAGGIFDQLGGGFCRYAVDNDWQIPHFEKMLYDNGPLLALYAEAACATGDTGLRRVAEQTAEWVMREMQSAEGGYYSALDADSEGEEGRFYVWTPAEVRERLTTEEYAVVAPFYGLDGPANFEGRWHLRQRRPLAEVAAELGLDETEAEAHLEAAREKLLAARAERVRPGRDEKILTSWNGLMIRGMAVAGLRLGRPDFIASAERALAHLRKTLWRNGRLLATAKDGRAHLPAYLDDYAFLADGLLALLQARWRDEDLQWILELMEVLLGHFRTEAGGFFFTADDHEALIQRPAVWADDAMPSGNGVAAQVLLQLGYLLGNGRYLAEAEDALGAAWGDMESLPHGHNAMLHALQAWLQPTDVVVIRGPVEALDAWTEALGREYAPHRLVLAIPNGATPPGVLAGYSAPPDGHSRAWLCREDRCLPPVDSLAGLRELLAEPRDQGRA